MYEHAYHLDFGANAPAYIDAFMRNVDWTAVTERMAAVHADRALPSDDPSDQSLPSLSVEELAARLAKGEPVQVLDARPRHHISRRSEEHTSELQSQSNLVCRLLLEKKKNQTQSSPTQRLQERDSPPRLFAQAHC